MRAGQTSAGSRKRRGRLGSASISPTVSGTSLLLRHGGSVVAAPVRPRGALLPWLPALLPAALLGACEATADVLTRHVAGDGSTSSTGLEGTSVTTASEGPGSGVASTSAGVDSDETDDVASSETSGTTPSCPPRVRITTFDLGVEIVGATDARDTAPLPLALAAHADGGAHLAALGTDGRVHVVELDELDEPVGFASSFVANDLVDLHADGDGGGILAVTRDARGGGALQCGDPTNLCNPPPEPVSCHEMVLVRFDHSGTELWATSVTPTSETQPPYGMGTEPTSFVWRYQHHGRIASDGAHHALYFGQAIAGTNNGCVDIYQGDRMEVVDASGTIVDHPDAFWIGCSISWTARIVWDERAGEFVMLCATDGPPRVARPAPPRTVLSASSAATLTVGDLVLAPDGGYWASISDQGTTRLVHVVDTTPDLDVPAAPADASHLVSLGPDLLLAWASDSGMSAQLHDARTGATKTDVFAIDVPDHRYQAFEAFPDGSAAFAARGPTATSVQVARVFPCAAD